MIDIQKSLHPLGDYRETVFQNILNNGHAGRELSMLMRQYHETDGMKYDTLLKAMIFHLHNQCDDLLERLATAQRKAMEMPVVGTFVLTQKQPGIFISDCSMPPAANCGDEGRAGR